MRLPKWAQFINKFCWRYQLCGDWYKESRERERLEKILKRSYTKEELKRIDHLHGLEEKNKKLKKEVRYMQLKAEEFNNLLYATGLIVNCTGCIAGAPANYENLTEEKVKEVEIIAGRLRIWWDTNKNRINKEIQK